MKARNIEVTDLIPGAVLRMVSCNGIEPFSDCVIESVDKEIVTLVRPYARYCETNVMMSMERFQVNVSRLIRDDSLFKAVLHNSESLYVIM